MNIIHSCFDYTIQCYVIGKHVYFTIRGNCCCYVIDVADEQQRAKHRALWNTREDKQLVDFTLQERLLLYNNKSEFVRLASLGGGPQAHVHMEGMKCRVL